MDYLEIYQKEHIENKLSYSQIREKYNIPRGTWDYYIRCKAKLSSDKRTYRVNDTFFDNINSEEKAYLLGFLYADGYLAKDGRIGIRLKIDDVEILQMFQKYICPDTPIVHTNNQNLKRKSQVNLRWKSKQMYERLKQLGFNVDKTHTNSSIFKNISENYKLHFMRGFTDGDGCLQANNLENGHKRKVSICWSNGTKEIFLDIKNWLNINSMKLYDNNTYFVLRCDTRKDVYEIVNVLYNNCNLYLKRKKEIADRIIKFCSKNTELT